MTNTVHFRVEDKIILKYYKVSIVIKFSREQRLYKITINKFVRLRFWLYETIIRDSLLTSHDIIFIDVLLRNVLNEVHLNDHIWKLIQIVLIQMTHASMSELINEIREHTIGGQSTISTLSEIQKEEITITSIDKLQIVFNKNTLYLIKEDSDIEV